MIKGEQHSASPRKVGRQQPSSTDHRDTGIQSQEHPFMTSRITYQPGSETFILFKGGRGIKRQLNSNHI